MPQAERSRRRLAWILAVPVLATAVWLGVHLLTSPQPQPHQEPGKTEPPAAEALSVSIRLIPGPDAAFLLELRLFSRHAVNVVGKRKRGHAVDESRQPVSMDVDRSMWKEKIRFQVRKKDAARFEPLFGELELVRASQEKKAVFGPTTRHQALYRLPGGLASGDRLRAVLTTVHGQWISNTMTILQPSAKGREEILSLLRYWLLLQDYQRLGKAADKLIALHPQESDGYWYKGLALEKSGQAQQALSYYLKTKELYEKSRLEQSWQEPPVLLWQRIRDLEKQVGKSP